MCDTGRGAWLLLLPLLLLSATPISVVSNDSALVCVCVCAADIHDVGSGQPEHMEKHMVDYSTIMTRCVGRGWGAVRALSAQAAAGGSTACPVRGNLCHSCLCPRVSPYLGSRSYAIQSFEDCTAHLVSELFFPSNGKFLRTRVHAAAAATLHGIRQPRSQRFVRSITSPRQANGSGAMGKGATSFRVRSSRRGVRTSHHATHTLTDDDGDDVGPVRACPVLPARATSSVDACTHFWFAVLTRACWHGCHCVMGLCLGCSSTSPARRWLRTQTPRTVVATCHHGYACSRTPCRRVVH